MVYTIDYRVGNGSFSVSFPKEEQPRSADSIGELAKMIVDDIPDQSRVRWNIGHQTLGEIFKDLVPQVNRYRQN